MTHSSTRSFLRLSSPQPTATHRSSRRRLTGPLGWLTGVVLLLCNVPSAWAGSGIFNGFVRLNTAGNTNLYDLNGTAQNTQTALYDFNGTNLGTYGAGAQNLTLIGGEAHTYKDGGCNVTNARLMYRVYPAGSPSGSFASMNLPYSCDEGGSCGIAFNTNGGLNQKWQELSSGSPVNVLAGLTTGGQYTLEVYLESDYNNCSFGTNYWTDGGFNYKATFYYSTLCGTSYTINSGAPASGTNFQSFTTAITALNAFGVTCPTTFNVAAGTTYSEIPPTITAYGSAANPVIFRKDPSTSGANPKITATAGVSTGGAATTNPDALISFSGADYITFDGIDLADAATNTTQDKAMEMGFGFFRASATNGCQNNVVKNCVVTLQRSFNGTAGSFLYPVGIAGLNSTTGNLTDVAVSSATGANSNNQFYSNTLQNVNTGIELLGSASATATSAKPSQ